MKPTYTTPKIVKPANGGYWIIYYRYNGKAVRLKESMNRIKDLKERQLYADALLEATVLDLKAGYNPFAEKEPLKPKSIAETMTLMEALDFGLNLKRDLAPKSYSGYKGTVSKFKTAIVDLNYIDMLLRSTERIHIKELMDKAAETEKWSKKSWNKNLTYVQAVLAECVKKFYININPAHNIEFYRITGKSKLHNPADEIQHRKIAAHLQKHPNFFNYVETEYHSGMRPDEILLIQIYMIDLVKDRIVLPLEICKDNEERIIPINKHFRNLLISMDVWEHPKDYYLFGSFRTPGRGNVGSKLDFVPGPTRLKRDTATKRWNRLIRNPNTGLGINVTLYSYKKFGVNAKLASGMSLMAIGGLLGHADEKTTRIYATDMQSVIDKEVYEKSPPFLRHS